MKKFVKFAFGLYAYWYANSLALALIKRNGYDTRSFGEFWSKSADFAERRNLEAAEMLGYRKVTEEEDEFDPDDYDWEHIKITVN